MVYGDAYLFQMNGKDYLDFADEFIAAAENRGFPLVILGKLLDVGEKRVGDAGGGR